MSRKPLADLKMTDILGVPHVPFLPPEIHVVIAQYLRGVDLGNYRLASKVFAEAGKQHMFHTLTFRATCASVSRLERIGESRLISKLVRALIWDVTLWRVGCDVRDWHEWTRHCESRATQVAPGQAVLYKELSASRQYWEAYLTRRQDEKKALQRIHKLWSLEKSNERIHLPGLQEVQVVKGAYHLDSRHRCTANDHRTSSVTVPLKDWKGDFISQSFMVQQAIDFAGVKSWRFQGLTVKELNLLWASLANSDMAEFQIRLSSRSGGFKQVTRNSWLGDYLGSMHNLEAICVNLNRKVVHPLQAVRPARTVQGSFGLADLSISQKGPQIWPRLRMLMLCHFDSSSEALLSLIVGHSSTLRILELHSITLREQEVNATRQRCWPQVFESIGLATSLERIVLSERFYYVYNNDVSEWNLDDKHLANAVTSWIINGGECPMRYGRGSGHAAYRLST